MSGAIVEKTNAGITTAPSPLTRRKTWGDISVHSIGRPRSHVRLLHVHTPGMDLTVGFLGRMPWRDTCWPTEWHWQKSQLFKAFKYKQTARAKAGRLHLRRNFPRTLIRLLTSWNFHWPRCEHVPGSTVIHLVAGVSPFPGYQWSHYLEFAHIWGQPTRNIFLQLSYLGTVLDSCVHWPLDLAVHGRIEH